MTSGDEMKPLYCCVRIVRNSDYNNATNMHAYLRALLNSQSLLFTFHHPV